MSTIINLVLTYVIVCTLFRRWIVVYGEANTAWRNGATWYDVARRVFLAVFTWWV